MLFSVFLLLQDFYCCYMSFAFIRWILTKNYQALRKGMKGNIGSFCNIIMELKKCCNHAMLVRTVENPNNLEYLQVC